MRETTPGKLPAFIESLLSEGWLAQVLHERDDRAALRRGQRYLSNITIISAGDDGANLPQNRLATVLSDFVAAGPFKGRYEGPSHGAIEGSFEQDLAKIYARAETPRLSGVQIKAPMHLAPDGKLLPAIDLAFTHILRPAGTAGFEMLPIVEWLCLQLGRAAGFTVPDVALTVMPGGMLPALIVERFDIRSGPEDLRRLALEDFCCVLDLPASAKYDATIERMARGLRTLSTNPRADLEIIFRRAVFAWAIADGEMHLKNLALRIAEANAKSFTSVRLAPLYDAVTTRVFPGLAGDRMALKLNGKDDRLTGGDFLTLARTNGIAQGVAEAILAALTTNLRHAVETVRLPDFAVKAEAANAVQGQIMALVRARCAAFADEAS